MLKRGTYTSGGGSGSSHYEKVEKGRSGKETTTTKDCNVNKCAVKREVRQAGRSDLISNSPMVGTEETRHQIVRFDV